MSAYDPKGMARAALEREKARRAEGSLPKAAASSVQIPIEAVPLQDGRRHLVDRRHRMVVGIAASEKIAEQTRRFFA